MSRTDHRSLGRRHGRLILGIAARTAHFPYPSVVFSYPYHDRKGNVIGSWATGRSTKKSGGIYPTFNNLSDSATSTCVLFPRKGKQ
jgi:hypothetical protein